jgi:LemA protein
MKYFLIGIGLLVLVIFYVIATYNKIVRRKTYVEEAWAQIDTFLKRRFDLIPNLVEATKGYMKHEQETLTKVIEARNSVRSAKSRAEQIEANNQLSETLTHLFALSEAYPDLKANQNFLLLQEELIGTENKIASARRRYNGVVRVFNAMVRSFPAGIIAKMFSFKEEAYFEVTEAEREVPKVEF